jgi:type VI secretion system secreted protein VgrG
MARQIELTTPLGPDVLLFRALHGREELGRLSDFELSALSTRIDISPGDLLAKNITVSLSLQNGGHRYFNGYVTRFAQGGMVGRYYEYRMTVRSWLWFLTRTADCRIFQETTVPDIIKEVFADHPVAMFEDHLTGTYSKREYCVQYRETDFNFVSRLMEEEGIYYYLDHGDGRHVLKLVDSYSGHKRLESAATIPYYPPHSQSRADEEYIHAWTFAQTIQPGAVALDDYDFTRPKADLTVKAKLLEPHEHADYEVFDYPGEYVQTDDGDHYARARVDELHAEFHRAQAQCNVREIATGGLFSLTNAPRRYQEREYLIAGAEYTLQDNAYETAAEESVTYASAFTAMPSRQQFRPARITPEPRMQGPQTAVVVGPPGEEIWTEKYGRVKVQFHWDRYGRNDENSSCWIRVSHPWAGKGWGAIAIPRIGQEVIVDFLEGDPDQPIITGRVYNADSMPATTLPAGAVVSGIKSNTHKGKGYNELTMDDTANKEKITIHAQYDMNTTVEHDQTNTVKNDFTETIVKNAKIEISDGTYKHDVKTGTADYHVQGALTEKYDATQDTTVKDAITIKSTSGPIAISSDSQHVYINAATNIQLHVGSSMIWMDSGGQINIKGVNVAINGSATVTIKGGIVHSEADSEHQTKGAIVLSEGSATNTVKGGMVMLNP